MCAGVAAETYLGCRGVLGCRPLLAGNVNTVRPTRHALIVYLLVGDTLMITVPIRGYRYAAFCARRWFAWAALWARADVRRIPECVCHTLVCMCVHACVSFSRYRKKIRSKVEWWSCAGVPCPLFNHSFGNGLLSVGVASSGSCIVLLR